MYVPPSSAEHAGIKLAKIKCYHCSQFFSTRDELKNHWSNKCKPPLPNNQPPPPTPPPPSPANEESQEDQKGKRDEPNTNPEPMQPPQAMADTLTEEPAQTTVESQPQDNSTNATPVTTEETQEAKPTVCFLVMKKVKCYLCDQFFQPGEDLKDHWANKCKPPKPGTIEFRISKATIHIKEEPIETAPPMKKPRVNDPLPIPINKIKVEPDEVPIEFQCKTCTLTFKTNFAVNQHAKKCLFAD